MKFRKVIINLAIFFLISLPLLMWLSWLLSPSQHMKILIIDKTVLTKDGREHRSFNWVLKYKKFTKSNGDFYDIASDYFGFFPKENDEFDVHDLEGFTDQQLDSLSDYYDAVYFTDTYGIYFNEWYRDTLENEHSPKVYGGLKKNDYLLLKRMKARKKLVIAEFNFFASPSSGEIGDSVENLFKLRWTGWAGRYFNSLDSVTNPELPRWVIRLYQEQHHGVWPFKDAGIVFVHEDSRVEVLEKDVHLNVEGPILNTFMYAQEKFNVPEALFYPYWFDITYTTDTTNEIFAHYEIFPNKSGDSILAAQGIPKIFPAAFEHTDGNPFYYFCGDFCDYNAKFNFVQLKGIWYFQLMLLQNEHVSDGREFFLRYYVPLLHRILQDYYDERIRLRTN